MKRFMIFFLLIMLSFSTISCAVKPAEPLPENSETEADTDTELPPVVETSFPYVNEQLFHVKDGEALVIPFELTEAGYFKFIAFDATEYEEYTDTYWDNMPEFQLAFYDESEYYDSCCKYYCLYPVIFHCCFYLKNDCICLQ